MDIQSTIWNILFCLVLVGTTALNAQIRPAVYISDNFNIRHELKIDNHYMVYTEYQQSPPKFIRTIGGFTSFEATPEMRLVVLLEFNSNYKKDSLRRLTIPIKIDGENLVLDWPFKMTFTPLPVLKKKQDLEGAWLFATRGPDEGQERRGEENPRKTLKYLQDDRFQWIAYTTDTFEFFGTGGGTFSSQDGKYVENIDFFSKDDTRVGATLDFNYEIKDGDWHHTGENSKGEPLYEIWAPRK
ncbi:hypothetical protein LCGC14_1170450 [marine sediment metagenome]|uniref:Membrane or secreted protein n=2 Tax=root TaxID=1 RepID=A0A831QTX8_9FLAO|nr:hypothetical protein [Pricia antarctica]